MVCEQTCSCGNEMDKSMTFITQVNTDNIVMWETLRNNADLDYFKTLIMQEIWKTQNQHQEEFSAFSGVTRLCQ